MAHVENATIQLTTPGKWNVPLMDEMKQMFPKHLRCDTIMGWGCLDQDWLEITTDIDTSWGWCKPLSITDDQWNRLYQLLESGQMLMMVHYGGHPHH